MTEQKFRKSVFTWILLFVLLGVSNTMNAQCAGTDGVITVCEKDMDVSNQTFALYPLLQNSPSPGGTWSTNDPANFFALDRTNGIVNLWEVKNSGIHVFTYTNDACGESATVTINLGGYPGEENIDGTADACGDDSEVNLHSYIGDETEGKFQDFNGTWDAITPAASPHLNNNIFNAKAAGPGIYEFTHTVPAVDTCPSRQVRLLLEVQRPANSGQGAALIVCTTDDLSGLTNFDLNSLLVDEDVNGTWSEGPLTNELADLTDHTINVETIRDSYTYGTFTFTYTVFPGHAVCTLNRTSVDIIILPKLEGTIEAANYCLGPSNYDIQITDYDNTLIPDGTYDATYTLTSASGTRTSVTPLTLRNNGTGVFQIDADLVTLSEPTTIALTSLGPDVCQNIDVPSVSFVVSNPEVNAVDACEELDISVALNNIFDASASNANGNYSVEYILTAPSGTVNSFTLNNITFTSGNANFTIPSDQITETGDYDISVEVTSGFPLQCDITDVFSITPIPEAIQLDLIVDNACDATTIDVMVEAPILDNGSYAITYDVTQLNTSQVVISNTINFAGGTATYNLDVVSLEAGNYMVSVRSSQNDTAPCRLVFDFEENENFAISGIPTVPVAEEQQTFCLSDFPTDAPTLENIEVSSNGDILFYATATDTDILPLDTFLANGEDYFISNIDLTNNCEGSDRVRVVVTLSDPMAPTVSEVNPFFCAADNPNLNNLNTFITSGLPVAWFDAAQGGTALDTSETLIDGQSYFAATEIDGTCLSTNRLEIVPTVFGLEPATLQFTELAICGLDNPTIADLTEIEGDNAYAILWYDSPENGNPLENGTPLIENTTYYAESYNADTGCINPERIAVTIDLSNCEPEDYGFYIPDGFSPNNDSRNDTFFIPNIEVIFPDFTLEILNRYGSSLFKGDKSNPAWDGDNAPNGVYFYIIKFNKQGHEPKQGRLYLNR